MRLAAPRTALVTGANGSIGRSLCAAFRKAGWRVVGTDRQPSARANCEVYVRADLARLDAGAYRTRVLERLRAATGDKLAALVNNAALQVVSPIEKLTVRDWVTSYAVNVHAPFLLAQGLLRVLQAAGGAVVNIASIHATQTKRGFAAYASSKAALVGLTRSLAVELGGRVRVNAICPAAVSTPMLVAGFRNSPRGLARLASFHPGGAIATPDEVAAFVIMLASGTSKYATGAIVNLDGGISSRLFDPD